MMEVLAFVDGVDAMTSKVMQARRSYEPQEMLLNEQVRLRAAGAMRAHAHWWQRRATPRNLCLPHQASACVCEALLHAMHRSH